MLNRTALLTLLLLAAFATSPTSANTDNDIGNAASITTNVEGDIDGKLAALNSGDPVFQNQAINTDETGVAQIEFRDGTQLAVGPGSAVVLDTFVYDTSGSASKVAIGLARGSFRFITGGSSKDAYEINTPVATIGVRGTAFDLYTKEDGEMVIAMIDGAVIVCPRNGDCRDHDAIGSFLHMTGDGIFIIKDVWDGTFLSDITFARAFPFLRSQDGLIDTMKGSTEVVARYVVKTGEAITDVGTEAATTVTKTIKKILRPKKPKVRLPKLFK